MRSLVKHIFYSMRREQTNVSIRVKYRYRRMMEFQRYSLVRFLTLITSVMQLGSLVSGHGFTHMSMESTQNGRNLLTSFTQTGIGLEECTLSCSLRPKCFSLGYERITGHCKLYSELSVDQPVLQTEKQRRSVFYVERIVITSEVV